MRRYPAGVIAGDPGGAVMEWREWKKDCFEARDAVNVYQAIPIAERQARVVSVDWSNFADIPGIYKANGTQYANGFGRDQAEAVLTAINKFDDDAVFIRLQEEPTPEIAT